MDSKQVLLIVDNLDSIHKFSQITSDFNLNSQRGSTKDLERLLNKNPRNDLVIYESNAESGYVCSTLEQILVDAGSPALLLIVKEETLDQISIPLQINCDFVVNTASFEECSFRVRQLLWPGNDNVHSDLISFDSMTINLATYQVKVKEESLDFTYLEYALLAFLVTHPERCYSRDALLQRVWGFDYYGGSRTVDVHVRRIRAKLGPGLAEHLETVRGVGYLWSR